VQVSELGSGLQLDALRVVHLHAQADDRVPGYNHGR
jgi:hypothetical protein